MEKIRTLADVKQTMEMLEQLLRYVDSLVLRAEQDPQLYGHPKLAEFKQRRAEYQRDFEALRHEVELLEKWGDDEYTYRPARLDGGHPGSQG